MSRLYAVIDPASPRYAGWVRDLGRDFVPVQSAETSMMVHDHFPDGPVPCYLLDLDAMPRELLLKVVERTAREFGATEDEVVAEFRELGMPVLAESVIVCEDPNEGRLRFPFWSGKAVGS